jgi:DNA mismatch endonuclease, patch repair protein
MADVVSPDVRSRMMAGIKGRNTKPELLVRSGLHSRGVRFRLHRRDVTGVPDLLFPRYRAALFVHGCFWHQHDCHLFKWPSSRPEFWRQKLGANKGRDLDVIRQLRTEGWRVAIVWECAVKGREKRPLGEVVDLCESWLKSNEPLLEVGAREG